MRIVADAVRESTLTTGTGDYALAGAVNSSYQAFASALAGGDTCAYTVTDGVAREVGIGTYSSGANTLARTTILSSTNGGAAVSWGAGSKDIFLDLPAQSIAYPATRRGVPAGQTVVVPNGYSSNVIGPFDIAPAAVLHIEANAAMRIQA
jgi:hypothetical protein